MSTTTVLTVPSVVQTRVAADLATAIQKSLHRATNGAPAETLADFMRSALWNECERRGQAKPAPPVALADLVKRIDLLAAEVQKVRNGTAEQLALTRAIAAELTPSA